MGKISSMIFWPRARSEAVLVNCVFFSYKKSHPAWENQKVSPCMRKPEILILNKKTGKSHSEWGNRKSHPAWENRKVSFWIRKPESLILNEETKKSHPAWENRKVSSWMRKTESLILHEKPNSLILHKKTKSLISLILKDPQRHPKTPSIPKTLNDP